MKAECMKITGNDIKKALLEVVDQLKDTGGSFQVVTVLGKFQEKIQIQHNDKDAQQAVLTVFYDLFRVGYLAWGIDMGNPSPPFIHVTEKGRKALQHLSRDPGNPEGYMHYLHSNAKISEITESYLIEALEAYNSGLYKSSAVMIGCSAESVIVELSENLKTKLKSVNRSINNLLEDSRVKKILSGTQIFFENEKSNVPYNLYESFEANWPAFTQQIRKIRNDAGHPANLATITEEDVHASLLVFPELVKLANQLNDWVNALK